MLHLCKLIRFLDVEMKSKQRALVEKTKGVNTFGL